jgi:hypothetical protein
MAREKKQQLTTEFGTASYPWLTSPDTKFNKAGVYSVNLVFDEDDSYAQSLVELIDSKIEESYQAALEEANTPAKKKKVKKANAPYSLVEDDETGEPTGQVKFVFKMNATGKGKDGSEYTRKPKLYDAAGKDITNTLKGFVGGGSVLRVSFNFSQPWYMAQVGAGVTMYLNGVQIKELVQSGASADAMGFGEVEGGYVNEDVAAAPTSDADNDDDAIDDGDF